MVILMIFYLLRRNTINYRRSTTASNNRRLVVVRSAISQKSQANVHSAINKETAMSHNFDIMSKIIKRKYNMNSRAKKHDIKKF